MNQPNSTPKDLAYLVYQKLQGAKIKTKPSEEILNDLFETLFYTSLKTEESQFIKVTITLIDPENPDPFPPGRIVADRWNHTSFEQSIPFNTKNLVKLSKAADPWSSSLAVFPDSTGVLQIWGMIDQAVHYQSFLNYETDSGPEQPGLFQTTITGIGSLVVIFDYELMATLKQNVLISNFIDVFNIGPISDFLINSSKARKRKIKNYVSKEFPDNDIIDWSDFTQTAINEAISRILLSTQNYKHGGAILITPNHDSDLHIKYKISYDRLSNSINNLIKFTVQNTSYSDKIFNDFLEPGKKNLSVSLYLGDDVSGSQKKDTRDELKGAIRFVSSLTCIDGLVVLSPNLKVEGFGAVIQLKELPEVIFVSKTSAVRESYLSEINPNHFGTRHRSMFSYCWNNPGSLGFVISQDGDIRAIMKLDEKLIMWENLKVQRFLKSDKLKRLPKRKVKK